MGYCSGTEMRSSKVPPSNGVPSGPCERRAAAVSGAGENSTHRQKHALPRHCTAMNKHGWQCRVVGGGTPATRGLGTHLDQRPPAQHVGLVREEVDAGLRLVALHLLELLEQPGAGRHGGVPLLADSGRTWITCWSTQRAGQPCCGRWRRDQWTNKVAQSVGGHQASASASRGKTALSRGCLPCAIDAISIETDRISRGRLQGGIRAAQAETAWPQFSTVNLCIAGDRAGPASPLTVAQRNMACTIPRAIQVKHSRKDRCSRVGWQPPRAFPAERA